MIRSPGMGKYDIETEDIREWCDANWIPYDPKRTTDYDGERIWHRKRNDDEDGRQRCRRRQVCS